MQTCVGGGGGAFVCVSTFVNICVLLLIKWIVSFLPSDIYPPVDPPQITKHPTPLLDVIPGSTVKLTINATGGGDLTYKWQWDGTDLDPIPGVSGETASTLQIENVKKSYDVL